MAETLPSAHGWWWLFHKHSKAAGEERQADAVDFSVQEEEEEASRTGTRQADRAVDARQVGAIAVLWPRWSVQGQAHPWSSLRGNICMIGDWQIDD